MKTVHKNISGGNAEVRTEHRDRIDLLRSRVGLLKGKDRVLMTMYIENGNSFRQMARLVGVNEVSIARRIHKVTKRLINGEYIMCLRNRDKFDEDEMDIARDYFLAGLSMKKIAARRNLTYYGVRKGLKRIEALIRVADSV